MDSLIQTLTNWIRHFFSKMNKRNTIFYALGIYPLFYLLSAQDKLHTSSNMNTLTLQRRDVHVQSVLWYAATTASSSR